MGRILPLRSSRVDRCSPSQIDLERLGGVLAVEGDAGELLAVADLGEELLEEGVEAAALVDGGLEVARLDPSVDEVVLAGNGPSFCSGGDLAEFGSFTDPASAHLARTRHSPALVLAEITARLGPACRAELHGQVQGSGLEMAAFCGTVSCHPDAVLGLPELALGLIPGAGGTVSITRRIGRWRTAYLVLSGRSIDPATALRWGLVDVVAGRPAR